MKKKEKTSTKNSKIKDVIYDLKESPESMVVAEPLASYGVQTQVPQTGLNPTQMHLLKMFSVMKTDKELEELREVLLDFYQKKLQKEADRLWDEGKLGNFLLDEHLRTKRK